MRSLVSNYWKVIDTIIELCVHKIFSLLGRGGLQTVIL